MAKYDRMVDLGRRVVGCVVIEFEVCVVRLSVAVDGSLCGRRSGK